MTINESDVNRMALAGSSDDVILLCFPHQHVVTGSKQTNQSMN